MKVSSNEPTTSNEWEKSQFLRRSQNTMAI